MDAKLRFSSAHTIMDYQDIDGNVYRRATPRLVSVVNAEEKRHIIGDTFVKVAEIHVLGCCTRKLSVCAYAGCVANLVLLREGGSSSSLGA